jgi:exopolysaccharide biosynthesis polyprenyl glycosylphosphotransferase
MYNIHALNPSGRTDFAHAGSARHPSVAGNAALFKRAFDQAVAGFLLALLAPMLLAVALLIRLDSPGPVLFKQQRVGLGGAPFEILKFRTMTVGAEGRQTELQAFNEMAGPLFKMKNDPRVTRLGRWLRLTSLDELPQLVNVLKGDMSLVGPRPPMLSEVQHFEPWQLEKFHVRPGITGLWQTSGRSQLNTTAAMVELDVRYIRDWSVWLDLKLLMKTAWVVATCKGAC